MKKEIKWMKKWIKILGFKKTIVYLLIIILEFVIFIALEKTFSFETVNSLYASIFISIISSTLVGIFIKTIKDYKGRYPGVTKLWFLTSILIFIIIFIWLLYFRIIK
jgi:hypothetical protein